MGESDELHQTSGEAPVLLDQSVEEFSTGVHEIPHPGPQLGGYATRCSLLGLVQQPVDLGLVLAELSSLLLVLDELVLHLRNEGFSLLDFSLQFSDTGETGRYGGPPLRKVAGVSDRFEAAFGQRHNALELRRLLASVSEGGIGEQGLRHHAIRCPQHLSQPGHFLGHLSKFG